MDQREDQKNNGKPSQYSKGEKLILLIDDDETSNFLNNLFIGEVVAKGIPSRSFQVATDAISFLDQLIQEDKHYDILVFLDINMPVMDGFEFLEAVQEKSYKKVHLTIIMLTSSLHPRDRQKAAECKVYQYLVKPLNENLLRELLSDLKIPVKGGSTH